MRIDDLLAPESKPGIEMRWRDLLSTGLATARVVLMRPDGSRLAVRYGAFANVIAGVHVGGLLRRARPGQPRRRARRAPAAPASSRAASRSRCAWSRWA